MSIPRDHYINPLMGRNLKSSKAILMDHRAFSEDREDVRDGFCHSENEVESPKSRSQYLHLLINLPHEVAGCIHTATG